MKLTKRFRWYRPTKDVTAQILSSDGKENGSVAILSMKLCRANVETNVNRKEF